VENNRIMGNKMHNIAMSGSTGFVGSNLKNAFKEMKWEIVPLGRKEFNSGALTQRLKGADAIVNLAGAPVIKRWSQEYKNTMYESRVNITKRLVAACSEMNPKPAVLISASAIGYYASGGPHTEKNHVKEDGFLGHLAQDWEEAALKANELGIRTVIFRFDAATV
jgi:NAD dependent epimerase/dehydratase family enzyme